MRSLIYEAIIKAINEQRKTGDDTKLRKLAEKWRKALQRMGEQRWIDDEGKLTIAREENGKK